MENSIPEPWLVRNWSSSAEDADSASGLSTITDGLKYEWMLKDGLKWLILWLVQTCVICCVKRSKIENSLTGRELHVL